MTPDLPTRYDVKTFIQTLSGPIPDTPEYARIRRGSEIAAMENRAGSIKLVSYARPEGQIRFAIVFDQLRGDWRVTSWADIEDAQADYATGVQTLTDLAGLETWRRGGGR